MNFKLIHTYSTQHIYGNFVLKQLLIALRNFGKFKGDAILEHSARLFVSKGKLIPIIKKMKKVYLFSIALLTLLFAGSGLMAQDFGSETTMTRQEARKAARAAHKKAVAAENRMLFEQAVECLKEGTFVIEVDQLLFPKGLTKFVSGITNFVSMKDGKAVIQIATSYFNPGPNGVGGITVEGNVSNVTMSTSKRGVVYYNFMDQGIAVSATVNIVLAGDGNRATVTVYPNFNSNNLTMTGRLIPYDQSNVFQGQTF